ncbi:MAG: HAD family hydrolase [Candidatus Eremiobacteraeota bacterium]|nr:HAD family hydrolase [Candidatus Eremiobacteraeota bacterium]MBV8366782.1 HAD family hydrolase [Candidatus Eremiobacteraeota bacterium]
MKAVFVDRDGTLNVNTGYVGDPADVVIVPHAARGVRALNDADFAVVVVSNQSGIARGYFTDAQADAVDARVRELLAADGARIDAMYRCPHWPADERAAGVPECDCRKPKPGLLRAAAADLGIELALSWMVGDRLLDMEAGRAAGCRCVLVPGVPPHQPAEDMSKAPPDYRARDLADAARFIIDTQHTGTQRPAASPRAGSR